MKRNFRGKNRTTFIYDFNLYRHSVPIRDSKDHHLSVIDMWPENVEQTIVFQHGFGGAGYSWEHQINHFISHYRVIVPDFRGHGQSDAPYTQYTMDELVADLEAIADHLDLPDQFILVGHSFGGAVCVEYANRHPDRVEKLVLIATAGEYPMPKIVQYLKRIPTSLVKPLWRIRPIWDADLHAVKRMAFNNMLKWQGWPLLRNLSMPTLIITGERDTVFPRYAFDEVGNMVPHAEIYDVGVSKHQVQLERQAAVNRAVDRFIGEKRSSWRDATVIKDRRPWLSHYPEDTPATIPIPRQTMHRFLESAAEWRPNHTAIVYYGQKMSYQTLNERTNQLAFALQGLGIRHGDRVILVLPNVPQMVIAYYAIMKIGAVVVLPNPDADAPRILHQVRVTGARLLITLDVYGGLANELRANSDLENVMFVNVHDTITQTSFAEFLQSNVPFAATQNKTPVDGIMMKAAMEGQPTINPDVVIEPDALANINFTSGTTEAPKGVCLTHRNLVANALQTRHWIPDLRYGKEVMLSVMPFLHSYGLTGGMNVPVTIAATMVILSVFELQQVLDTIKRYEPTLFPGVPAMYTAINQAPNVRRYGLASIKACISGAAPLPIEVQESFEKLTRGRLVEGYGLTEASPVTHSNPLYGVRKVGSIGIPIPNTDAKIIDLVTGEDVPVGKIGELLVRGPQVMAGYWGEDGINHDDGIIEDGWLHTGDVAVMDSDGYFKIISRKRDTIMTGSYSVYPRDVEEVLYENNKVLEVAVVGVGLEAGAQKVKAFVVPRPDTSLTEEELLALCRRRLEDYAVPWEIEFRETLPKSFVGKVLRRMLTDDQPE